jgi:hypothetical protein
MHDAVPMTDETFLDHLAGTPGYLVVGDLALNRVLRGDLPRPAT